MVTRSTNPKALSSMLGIDVRQLQQQYASFQNKNGLVGAGTGLGKGKLEKGQSNSSALTGSSKL